MVFSNEETKKLTLKIQSLDKLLEEARKHGKELEAAYQQCLTMKMKRQQERQQKQRQQQSEATISNQSAMDIFQSMTSAPNYPNVSTSLGPVPTSNLLNIQLDLSVPTRSQFQEEEEEEED